VKRPFLAVNDYGMGGVWLYIDARSAQEIVSLYPELTVYEQQPAFLSQDELDEIKSHFHFDIDAPPRDYLAALIAARGRKE
jgi:hypothetical protein